MQQASHQALLFEPLFMERIWGGRRLEEEFAKNLPPNVRIGESWELVDRPEAQSVVRNGSLRGSSLHELWTHFRNEMFGSVAGGERFPLLIKLLDARDTLSLQVHPPAHIAPKLNGQPKTEFWYVAKAEPDAKIYAGLRDTTTAEEFKESIASGTVSDKVHAISVTEGDAIFLPAGRFHAIGAGNLLVEIQQNSDTTYRVYDWDRVDDGGQPRELHIQQALQCIDFTDCQPTLVQPDGEILLRDDLFQIEKWNLKNARELAPAGQFAIVCGLEGEMTCAGATIWPGDLCLLPANVQDRMISPVTKSADLLRITIPS